MSHDPDSVLRPLHARAPELERLRSGGGGPAELVRVVRAVEDTLRRLLRDDATAPLDVRLRALAPDDLSTEDLIADLRRRERLPVELAAGVHSLCAVVARIRGGENPEPGGAALAVSVAEGVERHVRAAPAAAMGDPADERTLPAPPRLAAEPERHEPVHAVPPPGGARAVWPWVAAGLLLLVGVLAIAWPRGGGTDAALRQGEAAYLAGDTAAAERHFRELAEADPSAPLPRVYLARIYREAGRRDEALRELRAGLEAAPREPALHVELGAVLLDGGHAEEAAERFRVAVSLAPENRRAWTGLVRALRAAGRPADAERALADAPPEVRALLGEAAPSRAP